MKDTASTAGIELSLQHLELRLRPLRRALRLAVAEQKRLNAALARPDVKAYCITDPHVDQLLEQIAKPPARQAYGAARKLRDDEQQCEAALRATASGMQIVLPLDGLAEAFALEAADIDTLLACAAAELHRGYARIFAFVQDEVTRQLPSIDLLCALTAESDAQWVERRRALGPHGNLRRLGLLLVDEVAGAELGRACRLAPRALQALTDPARDWRDLFCDSTLVTVPDSLAPECFGEAELLGDLAHALRGGTADLIGIWGERSAPVDDAVKAVARAADLTLRRWLPDMELAQALALAADTGSVLWLDARRLQDETHPQLAEQVANQLASNAIPVIVSSEFPWRPTVLLTARRYLEVDAGHARRGHDRTPVAAATAGIGARSGPGARGSLPHDGQRATGGRQGGAHRATQAATENPRGSRELCRMVAQKNASRFARPVIPRRGPDDLILPEHLRNQVLEIPRFYRALARVNESWGFGRMMSGGGLKALFTGDSGTGKTLAAEVIARELDLPLLKIDLAQLVSKWVGETEKNIDAAFREAEACHAILFFDEADTLFGKRGEIQQGSDRYAALEVGFLLQRVETFGGLAVLASNLRDEIDPAFIRRFHVLLHFPRPQVAERLRLWRRAFPPDAPLHPGVDLASLAHIDLTGAGIVSAGHTAALIAADAGSEHITHEHLAAAIARQFHREARILAPADLAKFRGGTPPALHARRRDSAAAALPQ